jgi:hypothetical protein
MAVVDGLPTFVAEVLSWGTPAYHWVGKVHRRALIVML